MDDRTLALLGDRDAAQRVTEKGELLPCPHCGNEHPSIRNTEGYGYEIKCPVCSTTFRRDFYGFRGELGRKRTFEVWNTRAPVLSPVQLSLLGIAWEQKKF